MMTFRNLKVKANIITVGVKDLDAGAWNRLVLIFKNVADRYQ
jgi:hypothetical protein